jgi:hypothetical protein
MDFISEEEKRPFEKGTFMWAVEQMKGGKKVRCKSWDANKGDCVFMDASSVFNIRDFEATDWMIYEKEDNWNLTDNFHNAVVPGDSDGYTEEDVKKCRDKILEDIKGWHMIDKAQKQLEEIINKRFGDL